MNTEEIYKENDITRRKVSDFLSKDEIQQLTKRSDLRGLWGIASTWAIIALTFTVMVQATKQPLWLEILIDGLALCLLGGRQLALAILTHEASHNTLFKTRWMNNQFTDWLCARPIWLDLTKYRPHHFVHHTKTGTVEDTDISLVKGLPTTRASLLRKFARDLTGITGAKFVISRILMDAEVLKWTVASDVEWLPREGRKPWSYVLVFFKNSLPAILMNSLLFGILYAVNHPQLYLAWVLAYLTTYPLFIRIRAMAEHAGTEMTTDMFKNTRTTKASIIARTLVAPCHVNFHIEHHVLASVPYYRLPQMHKLLLAKQAVENPPNYFQVLKILASK